MAFSYSNMSIKKGKNPVVSQYNIFSSTFPGFLVIPVFSGHPEPLTCGQSCLEHSIVFTRAGSKVSKKLKKLVT